jgi:methylamine--corrinoid protein Co-methyltransferase
MMPRKETVGVFESYDRARSGPRVDEKDWDRKITFQTAHKLKEKYKLKFDRSVIIPTDTDMIDRLYQAGLEMLVEMGIYCMDTGRVIKYTEEEVLMIPVHPFVKVVLPVLLYQRMFLLRRMKHLLRNLW